ncbi:hypothetical protein IV203_001860 [Nitzschia inconspicua]|uniref:Uncharacterized protein n=1 Tax=Nitzschia inconspicua TaxID=303405 RepID=A0A9K3L7Q9_9STRA|nr:hypothetical protein IV203_001860 [Nitzschia inconspicua]
MAEAKSKGKAKKFTVNLEWIVKYGLEVSTRDPSTSEVTTVLCSFCRSFGREDEDAERKRKRTMNAKYFSYPWRSDNFSCHLKQQHPVKWNEYTSMPAEEKQKFFVEKESAAVFNMRSFVQPEGSMKARIIAKQKLQFIIEWWLVVIIIQGLVERIEKTFSAMQWTRTLVCEQRQLLTALKQDIKECCYIKGPMIDEESISFLAAVSNDSLHGFHLTVNNYCVLRQEVASSIDEVGSFVQ